MSKGFSLIEILISCAILILFCSSYFLLLKHDLLAFKYCSRRYIETIEVENIMENTRSIPFVSLTSNSYVNILDIDPNTKSVEARKNGISLFSIRSRY